MTNSDTIGERYAARGYRAQFRDCIRHGDADCAGFGNGKCGFAGYRDWRIPNVNELRSLVDYGRLNPAIAPAFNTNCTSRCTVRTCSCTQSGDYWSSTTFPYATYYTGPHELAWYVRFGQHSIGFLYSGWVERGGKERFGYVRAVRGGS